ncbi:hypothetical protein COK29_30420, partial [Bacillus cereus]|uniref:hypothetical protein n=1 Tax=Bacillus cereus TaxID=1396 RepID=UPI000C00C615
QKATEQEVDDNKTVKNTAKTNGDTKTSKETSQSNKNTRSSKQSVQVDKNTENSKYIRGKQGTQQPNSGAPSTPQNNDNQVTPPPLNLVVDQFKALGNSQQVILVTTSSYG